MKLLRIVFLTILVFLLLLLIGNIQSHIISYIAHKNAKALCEYLDSPDRKAAVKYFKKNPGYLAPAMMDLINDEKIDMGTREFAFSYLEYLKDQRVLEQLLNLLKSRSWHFRFFSCRALGEIRSVRAVNGLLKLWFKSDEMVQVRVQAGIALAKIGGKDAVEVFKKTLNKDDDLYSIFSELALYALEGNPDDVQKIEIAIQRRGKYGEGPAVMFIPEIGLTNKNIYSLIDRWEKSKNENLNEIAKLAKKQIVMKNNSKTLN
jgi:HEAT repeat protein